MYIYIYTYTYVIIASRNFIKSIHDVSLANLCATLTFAHELSCNDGSSGDGSCLCYVKVWKQGHCHIKLKLDLLSCWCWRMLMVCKWCASGVQLFGTTFRWSPWSISTSIGGGAENLPNTGSFKFGNANRSKANATRIEKEVWKSERLRLYPLPGPDSAMVSRVQVGRQRLPKAHGFKTFNACQDIELC